MQLPSQENRDPDRSSFSLRQLLANLHDPAALQADPTLPLIRLNPGDVLFFQGDAGDCMYLVVSGVLGVRVNRGSGVEDVIDRLGAGARVGELALLSGQPRSATVFALDEASVIQVSQADFLALSPGERELLLTTDQTVANRWQRLQLAGILVDLFGDIDVDELHALQEQLEWIHVGNGDVLFHQGDEADGMYIVVNGRLRLQATTPEGKPDIVGEVISGETVGEFALIAPDKRSATVFAVRETNVVKMSRPVFERISAERPEWLRHLTRSMVERLRRTMSQPPQARRTRLNIAIIPAHATVDLGTFAADLAAALAVFGSVLALDSQAFDREFGLAGAAQTPPDAAENVAVTTWLSEAAARHHYLLFVADTTPTIWAQRCLNQADHVLIVADPQADPAPGAMEALLARLQMSIRHDLVLWHPPQTERPSGTLPWLEARRCYTHHHIRRGDAGHMARLARRMTGHAVGIVCSGGAALGFVQQGVYKALLELDIPIDYVGGTSMGAIMGGAIAAGFPYSDVEFYSQRMANIGVLDYTLPLVALTRSRNVMEILEEPFAGLQIEDLWIPFFCVSTNLTTAEAQVHERGTMWRAIRASMSIPGIFLPVIEDGEVLVDGGVIDNFPVSRLADRLESPHIIGVLISPFKERRRQYDYDTHISGWRALWHRLNPFARRLRLPTPASTLIWSMEINGRRQSRDQEALAELIISPNVNGFTTTDYGKWRELAQVGYETALEPLREWWQETAPRVRG